MKHFTTRAEQEAAEYNARMRAAAAVKPENFGAGVFRLETADAGTSCNQMPVAPSGNAGGEHEEHPRSSAEKLKS